MGNVYYSLLVCSLLIGVNARAQSIRAVPDSGTSGQSLCVTISGSGVDFQPTSNVSEYSPPLVNLSRNGASVAQFSTSSIPNDSTIIGTLLLPDTLSGGMYDLTVQKTSAPTYSYFASSAFRVIDPVRSIIAVNANSAVPSQSFDVSITGQHTRFAAGSNLSDYSSIDISLMRNGSTLLTTHPTLILSNTVLKTHFDIPANAAIGSYDVIVRENQAPADLYTGNALFHINAGPVPTITVSPDTGRDAESLPVTIAGQNTNFGPSANVSDYGYITIDVGRNGVVNFSTHPTSIASSTQMYATFNIPDSTPEGLYDVHAYAQLSPAFDLHGYIYIKKFPNIIMPHRNSAAQGDTVTVDFVASGAKFIYRAPIPQYATVELAHGSESIAAQSVSVTSDTSLTAVFMLPDNFPRGPANIEILEPQYQARDILRNGFTVLSGSALTGVTPNSAKQGETVMLAIASRSVEDYYTNIQQMALIQGGTTIYSSSSAVLPLGAMFAIPAFAPTGSYDLRMIAVASGSGTDTLTLPNAFTLLASSGVGPSSASGIASVQVFPTPAIDAATIRFELGEQAHVKVAIYDLLGHEITVLADRSLMPGEQQFVWPLGNIASGTYLYRIISGDQNFVGKIAKE